MIAIFDDGIGVCQRFVPHHAMGQEVTSGKKKKAMLLAALEREALQSIRTYVCKADNGQTC